MSNSPNFRAKGYAMIAVAASSWGLWPLILRRAEAFGPVDPTLEALMVMAALSLTAAPLLFRDRVHEPAPPRAWFGMVWLGIGDALNIIFFFRAYQATSVAIAVITHYLTPLFVALAAPLFLKEPARFRTFGAAIFGFSGLALMLRPWSVDHHATDFIGAACGAASAVFYASNVIVNKRLSKNFSGSELTFFHGLFAIPFLFLFVHKGSFTLDPRALGWLVLGALGPGAAAGLLFVWGLRRVPASHASTLTLLEPLVAVITAAMFLRERVHPISLVGAAIILGSAALVMKSTRNRA